MTTFAVTMFAVASVANSVAIVYLARHLRLLSAKPSRRD